MKKITICALTASLLIGNAVAAEKKEQKINPWTDCGIGAMIFSDNNEAAAISNIIWDLGTTAVTSQVSSADSCKGKNVDVALFIQDNYNKVLEETSQGSGEHLTAMLEMLEVETGKQSEVIVSVRTKMAKEVATNTSTQPEQFYNAVMTSI